MQCALFSMCLIFSWMCGFQASQPGISGAIVAADDMTIHLFLFTFLHWSKRTGIFQQNIKNTKHYATQFRSYSNIPWTRYTVLLMTFLSISFPILTSIITGDTFIFQPKLWMHQHRIYHNWPCYHGCGVSNWGLYGSKKSPPYDVALTWANVCLFCKWSSFAFHSFPSPSHFSPLSSLGMPFILQV